VKALLEQLRSSQAWQDVVSATRHASEEQPASSSQPVDAPPAGSVRSLLSQLHSYPSSTHEPRAPDRTTNPAEAQLGSSMMDASYLKAMSLQQALPHLANLSSKSEFVDQIREVSKIGHQD
jgi:hypothetical protein